MNRRLIEDLLPIGELSREARRPLLVARAAVFGALVPESEEERERMREFVIRLCKWETRDDERMEHPHLKRAREMIRRANGDEPPKVLDPSPRTSAAGASGCWSGRRRSLRSSIPRAERRDGDGLYLGPGRHGRHTLLPW